VCDALGDDKRPIPSICSAGVWEVETMTESMIGGDNNNAVQGTVTGSVSLKHIARRAAHAAERDVILQVLEQTQWNRVRAAKLLEISYRALLYKIKDLGLASASRTTGDHGRLSARDWD
jgi:DNA-binding NtrC family response regulator